MVPLSIQYSENVCLPVTQDHRKTSDWFVRTAELKQAAASTLLWRGEVPRVRKALSAWATSPTASSCGRKDGDGGAERLLSVSGRALEAALRRGSSRGLASEPGGYRQRRIPHAVPSGRSRRAGLPHRGKGLGVSVKQGLAVPAPGKQLLQGAARVPEPRSARGKSPQRAARGAQGCTGLWRGKPRPRSRRRPRG